MSKQPSQQLAPYRARKLGLAPLAAARAGAVAWRWAGGAAVATGVSIPTAVLVEYALVNVFSPEGMLVAWAGATLAAVFVSVVVWLTVMTLRVRRSGRRARRLSLSPHRYQVSAGLEGAQTVFAIDRLVCVGERWVPTERVWTRRCPAGDVEAIGEMRALAEHKAEDLNDAAQLAWHAHATAQSSSRPSSSA